MKKKIVFLVKVVISLTLIGLLFTRVHFGEFLIEFKRVDVIYFLSAVVVIALDWWLSAKRWGILLNSFSLPNKTSRLFVYILTGTFYSIVLPAGKVAGDVVRAYQIAKAHRPEMGLRERAFLSVFIDRMIGALTFLLFAAVFFVTRHPIVGHIGQVYLAGGPILVLSVVGLTLVFFDTLDFIFLLFKKIPIPRLARSLDFLMECLLAMRHNRLALIRALGISMLVVVLSAFPVYLFGLILGLGLGFWPIVFLISLSTLLTIVPITVAGIGLREGGLVFLLIQSGATPEVALAVSLLNLAVMVTLALVGGLLEFYYQFVGPNHRSQVL